MAAGPAGRVMLRWVVSLMRPPPPRPGRGRDGRLSQESPHSGTLSATPCPDRRCGQLPPMVPLRLGRLRAAKCGLEHWQPKAEAARRGSILERAPGVASAPRCRRCGLTRPRRLRDAELHIVQLPNGTTFGPGLESDRSVTASQRVEGEARQEPVIALHAHLKSLPREPD